MRPVVNVSDALTVRIKLKLSQLIDVNLKNQIMTTNLWVEQSWYDYKLKWEPREYGGVEMLHVPSDHIWKPDVVSLVHFGHAQNIVLQFMHATSYFPSISCFFVSFYFHLLYCYITSLICLSVCLSLCWKRVIIIVTFEFSLQVLYNK